jgi:hypothetical protein
MAKRCMWTVLGLALTGVLALLFTIITTLPIYRVYIGGEIQIACKVGGGNGLYDTFWVSRSFDFRATNTVHNGGHPFTTLAWYATYGPGECRPLT